jgi:hypothetical protein
MSLAELKLRVIVFDAFCILFDLERFFSQRFWPRLFDSAFRTPRDSKMQSIKKILPLMDRVLVQRVAAIEKTASGLFIPESARETIPEGIVISVGPGHRDEVMTEPKI